MNEQGTQYPLIELVPPDENDPRIRAAIEELRDLIVQRFPDAAITVRRGDDPEGFYLTAVVDVDDLDEVINAVLDRMVDMQSDEGLPVYVVPDWPPKRVREELRRKATQSLEERIPTFATP